MATFKILHLATATPTPLTRFAVGAESGSLYAILPYSGNMGVLPYSGNIGVVLIGHGSLTGREGKRLPLRSEEILPPGTVIEITA